MEVWKPIPSAPFHEACEDGRVRSLDRTVKHGPRGGERKVKGRIKKASKGTKYLSLTVQGKTRTVHSLINEAFNGPRPSPQHETRHLDGDRLNNRAGNLVWGTGSENQMDRFRHGTACEGVSNYRARHTEEDVKAVMAFRGKLGPAAISARTGLSKSFVKHVIYGQAWNWLTGLPRNR